jgi:hypothetical protein
MKIIASLIFGLFLVSANAAYGQAWREIKPLESTCQDVERLLGAKLCGKMQREHTLPSGGTISIRFSHTPCQGKWPDRYDVPPGTVISVQVFLMDAPVSIADLRVDESKFKLKKIDDEGVAEGEDIEDISDEDIYESEELGIQFSVSKKREVTSVSYSPPAKYDHLLCSRLTKDSRKKTVNR